MRWELPWKKWREEAPELLRKYKYVLAVLLAGVALLLWPGGEKAPEPAPESPLAVQAQEETFTVEALEEKLSRSLSQVRGAGKVEVVLTVQGGPRRVLARDEKNTRSADGGSEVQSTTVLTDGSGGAGEAPVLVQQLYPPFQGALVVCSDGDSAGVRLKLMEAVSALTGLGADKITICQGKD